jgi:hypothetical protein
MKKNKIVFVLILLYFASCSSANYTRVAVQVPLKTVLDINQFDEIIVSDFLIKKEPEGFDLNQELVTFFTTEMTQSVKGRVSRRSLSLENEELFKNASFWKELLSGSQKTVLFTGIAEYTQEIRKAVLQTKKKRSDDTFSRDRAIEERRFYTLNLSLYLIDSQTGETLYTQTFKETQGYKNPKQIGPFAFFDLAEKAKGKFFSQILSGVRAQQRFLIIR